MAARHKRGPQVRGTGTAVVPFPAHQPPRSRQWPTATMADIHKLLQIEERVPERGTDRAHSGLAKRELEARAELIAWGRLPAPRRPDWRARHSRSRNTLADRQSERRKHARPIADHPLNHRPACGGAMSHSARGSCLQRRRAEEQRWHSTAPTQRREGREDRSECRAHGPYLECLATRRRLQGGELPSGPKGDKGDKGDKGHPGPPAAALWANLSETGTLEANSRATAAAGTQPYVVTFNREVTELRRRSRARGSRGSAACRKRRSQVRLHCSDLLVISRSTWRLARVRGAALSIADELQLEIPPNGGTGWTTGGW